MSPGHVSASKQQLGEVPALAMAGSIYRAIPEARTAPSVGFRAGQLAEVV